MFAAMTFSSGNGLKNRLLTAALFIPGAVFVLQLCLGSAAWALNDRADKEQAVTASVAIIIDDLGYKLKQDQRAVKLPGQVTLAFLPHTPHVRALTETANSQGNEIMLHLPMQALETLYLGPGALTSDMTEQEFKHSVAESIRSIPYVKGINNHMGSLITSQKDSMSWLMQEIVRTGLFFVDSRTTVETQAQQTANEYRIANTRRNVFLDHERNRPAIEFQFNRLIKLAKKNGSAVAIGHPFSETLDVLEEKIPQLRAAGIRLIPVSELIQQQHLLSQAKENLQHANSLTLTHSQKQMQNKKRKQQSWQTSLSRSPRAVKN